MWIEFKTIHLCVFTSLNSLSNAGWILDNFPNTQDQLHAMLENNLLPDTFFITQDTSDDSNVLLRRWFNANKDTIEMKINKRLSEQKPEKM